MASITFPTIHLNGTSKGELIHELVSAYLKLNVAYEALKRTAPNGRDYYPQGEGAIQAAIEEHNNRLRRLDDVMNELDEIIGNIS